MSQPSVTFYRWNDMPKEMVNPLFDRRMERDARVAAALRQAEADKATKTAA